MTYHVTADHAAHDGGARPGFLSAIGRFFAAIGKAMISAGDNHPRMRLVRSLNAKSDAELARMGIKRDDIVHHVFRDVYYM